MILCKNAHTKVRPAKCPWSYLSIVVFSILTDYLTLNVMAMHSYSFMQRLKHSSAELIPVKLLLIIIVTSFLVLDLCSPFLDCSSNYYNGNSSFSFMFIKSKNHYNCIVPIAELGRSNKKSTYNFLLPNFYLKVTKAILVYKY